MKLGDEFSDTCSHIATKIEAECKHQFSEYKDTLIRKINALTSATFVLNRFLTDLKSNISKEGEGF